MNREEKNIELENLSAKFKEASNALLVQFQGINVEMDTVLRSEMRKAGMYYHVVKNTLAKRAVKETPLELLDKWFVGPTAVVINEQDPVSMAKIVAKFSKEYPKFIFKAGVVEGRILDRAEDLDKLANLPSREELMSKLMFLINSGAQRLTSVMGGTARNLAVVVSQIAEKKSNF